MAFVLYAGKLNTPIKKKILHKHENWEIVFYTYGHGTVLIDNKAFEFKENSIFFIPPNTYHTDFSDKGFQNYHCEFQDDNFPFKDIFYFFDSKDNEFLQIMKLIFSEYQLKRKNYHNITESLYNVLLNYISSLYNQKQAVHHQFVDFALKEIIENFSNPYYEFSQTMNKIPFNIDYFRRAFYEDMHTSPSQYLTKVRIENAKKLLSLRKQSKLSIQEISWFCGFKDSMYFSRVFKKFVNMSPTEYYNSKNSNNQ